MLSELFDFLRTPSHPEAKKLGYLYSSIALERRARRQAQQWQEHIHKCHTLWKDILSQNNFKRIAVLGSGPLTEIPVSEILPKCDELHLIDIIHPIRVRKHWKRHSKVHFHDLDMTGVVPFVASTNWSEDLPLDFQPPTAPVSVDLVVSANTLSQLSLEPSWYLQKKYKLADDCPYLQKFIQKIGEDHLEHLLSYGAQTRLVYTDLYREYLNPQGDVLEKHLSRVPLGSLGKPWRQWDWELCPLGEESKEFSISMHVGAYLWDN